MKAFDRTLVIIDMQDEFIDDNERHLIPVICELIKYARQQNWGIVFVEFKHRGLTNDTILETAKGYPHQVRVIKSGSDGGREVMAYLNNKKNWSFNLLICGIYGDECVPETVAGLFDHSDLVEVDVVLDAVYPPYCSSSEEDEHGQQRELEIRMENIDVLITEGSREATAK